MKKLLTVLLSALVAVSFAACGKKAEVTTDEFRQYDASTYNDTSKQIYDAQLGDFYTTYEAATAEVNDLGLRYAQEAVAEAKLLESAVMLPLTTRGGNYAINRVAPHTAGFTLWGIDSDKVDTLVVTNELQTVEDRKAMKEEWAKEDITGADYEAFVKQYLTQHGYTIKDTYNTTYTSEPQTYDALATSREADTDAVLDTVAGLLRYDQKGVQQPDLATSYEYTENEDGTVTYTFTLRQGVQWADAQGRAIGNLTADDFVAGFQHMMDTKGGLEYLVQDVVVGANDYIEGTTENMDSVGVKAVDDYTVSYTLVQPTPYFLSMLAYNVFLPLNRAYYTSQGGTFGADYATSGSGNYGTSPETIAYIGAFLISSHTENNSFVYTANPLYWNAANTNIKTYTKLFDDGTDVTKTYNDAVSGTIDGAVLNNSTIVVAKEDGNFDKYADVRDTEAITFMSFYNLNRYQFENVADGAVKSTQTANDANRTFNAMQNVHFRRALSFAYDRAAANAQSVGEDLKYNALRNSYTPYNFVSLPNEATVKVGGKDVTYPAGTVYGKIIQDVLDADGVAIKAYDPDQPNGGDGYDGYYNVDNAKSELETAIKELGDQGFTIDAEHPIYVDLPYFASSDTYSNKANAYKQSVESALDGKVIMNLVACNSADEWYNAGYYTDYGYEANYDIYDLSGWGPDYGDPCTYLDTMLPEGAGYMVKCIGLY